MCNRKSVVFVFLVFFFGNSYSACVDKFALASVNARVHKSRNSKASIIEDYNFNLLDDSLYIDIVQANVSQLCEGMIKNFPRLQSLTLMNLNLTSIEPGAFQDVPKLRHLSLSVNLIKIIPANVFNNITSLQVIYLTNNQIESIEQGAFAQMPYLKAVHLDRNKLTKIPDNIFNESPRLSLIDFSHNQITKVSKNNFIGVDTAYKTLNLHLQKNNINEIEPDALRTIMTSVNLHLERNELVHISNAVFSVRENSQLYFDNNKIDCIADNVVEWLKTKEITVVVKNNPVQCTCVERIEELTDMYGLRGELNVETTLPCYIDFFGNGL